MALRRSFCNSLYSRLCPSSSLLRVRSMALWSMKKDPDLEAALSRNRRWLVNNQIKNIILACPDQVAQVRHLQKKFKSLDLQGKALNWLMKYPCCFDVYLEGDQHYCRLSKRMMYLVNEEESVKERQEPVLVERLAKLLMMSRNHRLNVVKFNELKQNFGFPDDYVVRIVSKYGNVFRIVNPGGRKSSMDIELILWDPNLAVSAVEASARERGHDPSFSCSLPSSWVKSWERFREFNSAPYISPYTDPTGLEEGSWEFEKRVVGLAHEVLSLSLWKKVSINKLGHFRRELCLPEKLNVMLLKHPGIFYVSNKYLRYTVVLREGYSGSQLLVKDPLVRVKERFGELMEEGIHERNRRNHAENVEKRKKKKMKKEGLFLGGKKDETTGEAEMEEEERSGGLFDPEERRRFYKVLFQEFAPK